MSTSFFFNASQRWLFALIVAAFLALLAQPLTFPLAQIASLLLATFPLFLAFQIRSNSQSSHQSAWDVLAIGLATWWIADLLEIIFRFSNDAIISTPTFADLIRLVGYLLATLGVWRYPAKARASSSSQLRIILDIILVVGCTATILYDLKALPIIESSAPLGQRVWQIAYPLFGMFLVGVAAIALLRTPALAIPLSFLTLILGLIITISFNNIIGQTFIGVAAIITQTSAFLDLPSPGTRRARFTLLTQRLLPVIAVLTLFAETVYKIALGQINVTGLFFAILFSSILVVRQGVLLGENEFQRYAHLINSASDAAFMTQRNGQLVLANPATYELLGISSQKPIKDQAFTTFFQPAPPITNTQIIQEANEHNWHGEGASFHNGHPITLALALNALRDEAGTVNGLVGIARDITERKHMESKLRSLNTQLLEAQDRLLRLNADLEKRVGERTTDLTQANRELEQKNIELQTLDQLKSEFVSLVSHELRAPLTNINGGLELLLSKDGGMSLDSREALTLMSREGIRLTRLVEAILDLSTFDAGQLPITLAPIALQSLVPSVIEQFQTNSPTRRITWSIANTLPKVIADERGLRSSLTQLIDNALKYAPESPIEILAECDKNQIQLSVVDHGPGIPLEHSEKIFDRFHRVNPSDSQKVYGYGLGLHTTRRFLEAMESQITLRETPQGGATFCITLEVANAEPAISTD